MSSILHFCFRKSKILFGFQSYSCCNNKYCRSSSLEYLLVTPNEVRTFHLKKQQKYSNSFACVHFSCCCQLSLWVKLNIKWKSGNDKTFPWRVLTVLYWLWKFLEMIKGSNWQKFIGNFVSFFCRKFLLPFLSFWGIQCVYFIICLYRI